MRSSHALAAIPAGAVALLLAGEAAALEAVDRKLGIEVEFDESWDDVPTTYRPVRLTIENRKKETREIRVIANSTPMSLILDPMVGTSATSEIVLDVPRGETTVELPLLMHQNSYNVAVTFEVDGRPAGKLDIVGGSLYTDPTSPTFFVVGDGLDAAEEISALMTSVTVQVVHVPVESATRYWQCYAGLPGVVVVSAESVGWMDREQRLALSRWVRWGGGIVWLHGEKLGEALDSLDLPVAPMDEQEDLVFAPAVAGGVLQTGDLSERAQVESSGVASESLGLWSTEEWARIALYVKGSRNRSVIVHTTLPYYAFADDYYASSVGLAGSSPSSQFVSDVRDSRQDLLDGLHEIPRLGYCLISLLLALLIGPVNLVVLAAKKRRALLYVTAPALAVLGMLVLLAYTILDEGLTLKRNHRAVLLHDGASGEGAIYQGHGTFGGIAASSGPTLPVETAAVPFLEEDSMGTPTSTTRVVTDWTSAQRLASGWIASRQHRGMFTISPVRVRMGMELTVSGSGEVWMANGLPAGARRVLARVRDARGQQIYWWARDVAPGEKVKMKAVSETKQDEETSRALRLTVGVPWMDMTHMDWNVVAETDGLPHADAHGLGGEVVEDRYWYVGIAGEGKKVP